MNLLHLFTRQSNASFEPQQNVRFVPGARIQFETRRDEKKFRSAGLGHATKSGLKAEYEAKKHQPFNLVVDGRRMVGRIFEERHQHSFTGGDFTVMLIECRSRDRRSSSVVHVSHPF